MLNKCFGKARLSHFARPSRSEAEIFTPMAQATALPTCETSARVGTLLAPFFGTLPSAVAW